VDDRKKNETMKTSEEIITEVLPGKLWQGSIYPVEAGWRLPREVIQIASILDFKPAKVPDHLHHIYLEAADDTRLDPETIHEFCSGIIEMPTYVHCYSGFNRSTAMVCCSLILHSFEVPLSILNVLVKRNSELAQSHSGAATTMTWQMMQNVADYIDYLKKKGLEL
jgi:protein-tyrosine phosphatase